MEVAMIDKFKKQQKKKKLKIKSKEIKFYKETFVTITFILFCVTIYNLIMQG